MSIFYLSLLPFFGASYFVTSLDGLMLILFSLAMCIKSKELFSSLWKDWSFQSWNMIFNIKIYWNNCSHYYPRGTVRVYRVGSFKSLQLFIFLLSRTSTSFEASYCYYLFWFLWKWWNLFILEGLLIPCL